MKPTFQQRTNGRWNSILAEVLDDSYLTGKHCPCPICQNQSGNGGADRFRFDNKRGAGTYICGVCGAGTGLDLFAGVTQLTLEDAKLYIDTLIPTTLLEDIPKETSYNAAIKFLIRSSLPASADGVVGEYLSSRGIFVIPPSIRLTKYTDYSDPEKRTFDAMICKVQKNKKLAGIHLTLLENGKKASIPNPRRLLKVSDGSLNGGAIHLYPNVWSALNSTLLQQVEIPKDLAAIVIGEGIETSLSAGAFFTEPLLTHVIAGDNDYGFAGQAAAYSLAHRLVRNGSQVRVLIPDEVGTDWNDMLLHYPKVQQKIIWQDFNEHQCKIKCNFI